MIVLYVLLALVLLVFAVLFVNVHFVFLYREKGKITLRILFFSFDAKKLYQPFTKKEQSASETEPKADDQKTRKSRSFDPVGFAEFLVHVTRVISLAVKESFEKIKIDLKELHVSIGTDDAAKTALTAGAAIQAANDLCAVLQHFSNFRCDNRNLSVSPDFTSENSRFSIHLDLSIKLIHLIGVYLRAYTRFFERKESTK